MILEYELKSKKELKSMVVVKKNLYNDTEEVLEKIPSREEMLKIIKKEDIEDCGWVSFWAYKPVFNKYEKKVLVYSIAPEEDGVGLIAEADKSLVKTTSCQPTEVLGVRAVSCYHSLKENVYVLCREGFSLLEEFSPHIQKVLLKKGQIK